MFPINNIDVVKKKKKEKGNENIFLVQAVLIGLVWAIDGDYRVAS